MRIDGFVADATLIDKISPELNKLRRTTQQVEAVFLKELLGEMRKAAPDDDLANVTGSDIYQDMSDQAFADSASKSDSLGIAKLLYDRLAPTVVAQEQGRQLLQVADTRNR
jgi:Rod binding domain-containing protein